MLLNSTIPSAAPTPRARLDLTGGQLPPLFWRTLCLCLCLCLGSGLFAPSALGADPQPETRHTLTLGSTRGFLVSHVAGADFSTDLTRSFPHGTHVSVVAEYYTGNDYLDKWVLDGQELPGSPGLTVVMDRPHSLSALYRREPLPYHGPTLALEGPAALDERTSAPYRARLTFEDGLSTTVNPAWSVSDDHAQISPTGVLDAGSVDADRQIKIVATFPYEGFPLRATNVVTLRNQDPTPLHTVTLTASAGGTITLAPAGTWQPRGSLVSAHAVAEPGYVFSHWDGDAAGTEETFTSRMDGDRTFVAHFIPGTRFGALRVELAPPEAALDGAAWRYDTNTTWVSGGDTLGGLAPIKGRQLTFREIPGWLAPTPFKVDIAGDTTNVISGLATTYRAIPGVVRVTLLPAPAVATGARWRLDGGSWQTNNAILRDVPSGDHQVEFQESPGWTRPGPQTLTVNRAGIVLATGIYHPPLGLPMIGAMSPNDGPLEGGTTVTFDGANFSPNTTVFIGGRAATSVAVSGTTRFTAVTPPGSSLGEAAVVVTTSAGSVTNDHAFTYGAPRGSNLTFNTSVGGEYLAVAASGQHLFVGQGNTFQVYNLVNRTNPVLLASLPLPGLVHDIALEGDLAVVAASDAGVHLIDLSQPAAPRLRGHYHDPFHDQGPLKDEATSVEVLDGKVYATGYLAGLRILDVTDADAPALLSTWGPGRGAMDVGLKRSGNRLVAVIAASQSVKIVDVTDPRAPALVSEVPTPNPNPQGFAENQSVALAGDLAFVGQLSWQRPFVLLFAEDLEPGLEVIDLSDLAHPVRLERQLPDRKTAYASVAASGNLVAIAGPGAEPFKLVEVSGKTFTPHATLQIPVSEVLFGPLRMTIQDGVAWLARGTDLLGIVVTNLDSPQSVLHRDHLAGDFHHLTTVGPAFMATTGQASHGFTLSGGALAHVTSQPGPGSSAGLGVGQGVLLDFRIGPASTKYGYGSTDVSRFSAQPDSLFQYLGHTPLPDLNIQDAETTGDRVIIASLSLPDGKAMISEVDPSRTSPDWVLRQVTLANTMPWDIDTLDVVGAQDFFVVAASGSGGSRLEGHLWNASAPAWKWDLYANAFRLSHNNRYLHVIEHQQYRIYDLADPTQPQGLSTNTLSGFPRGILVDGDEAYVTLDYEGLTAFDITDKVHPRLIRSYDTPGNARELGKIGNHLVVADDNAGIQVLDLTDLTPPQLVITAPTTGPQFSTAATTVNLAGSTTDDSGQVRLVTWRNARGGDGLAQGTTNWSAAGVILFPGTNVISVTAYDAAGNAGTAQLAVVSSQPDTTPPVVNISSPTFDAGFNGFSFRGSVADDVAVASVINLSPPGQILTANITGQTWSFDYVELFNGPNWVGVTATDTAGNTATDSVFVFVLTPLVIVPESPAPLLTIHSPTLNATYASATAQLNLAATASDDFGVVRVEWSDGHGGHGLAQGAFSFLWTIEGLQLRPGLNLIELTAYDADGNTASDTLAVTFGSAPPPLELAPLQLTGGTFRFQVTGPAGSTITLQRSADFTQWEPAGTHTLSAAGTALVEVPAPAGGSYFYRALPTP